MRVEAQQTERVELQAAGPDVVNTLRSGARRGLVVVGVDWRGRVLTAGCPLPPPEETWQTGQSWVAGEAGAGTDRPQVALTPQHAGVAEPTLGHDLPHDDVPVQLHGQPGSLQRLDLVPVLVLRVHRHELEQHQVEQGGNDGQTEHDEEEGEDDVLWSLLEGVVLLESHQVSKPCRAQSSDPTAPSRPQTYRWLSGWRSSSRDRRKIPNVRSKRRQRRPWSR